MIFTDDGDLRRRPAFTLVEIVVVISIIIVLSGVTIAFLTNFNGPDSAARSATMVQQALTVARSEALRGRRPYGVRLVPDSTNSHVTKLVFIEQPDDFFGGRAYVTTNPATKTPTLVQFLDNIDLYGGFGPASSTKWPVQVGDYIELFGTGLVRQITGLVNTNGVCKSVTVQTAYPNTTGQSPLPPFAVSGPNQFRIIRMPRVVGEDPITLPDDTAIDITTNTTYGNHLPYDSQTQAYDILFSQSGAVIGRGTTETPIFLWVRNTTVAGVTNGDPTIIAIYPRTGSTAAHPINTLGNNPYTFAQDGRSSGL